jgi:hypothetical protein
MKTPVMQVEQHKPRAVVGIIDELIAAGCGIHQLPCPEAAFCHDPAPSA